MPSLIKALPRRGVSARAGDGTMSAADTADTGKRGPDVALLLCFALWYLGNYQYNIANKLALVAGGGAAGFPMTIRNATARRRCHLRPLHVDCARRQKETKHVIQGLRQDLACRYHVCGCTRCFGVCSWCRVCLFRPNR